MAWEWSHIQEAYDNAREWVSLLSRKTLLVILREWAYEDREKKGTLRFRKGAPKHHGFRLPNGIRRLPKDILAERVWGRMEELRTSDNGGYNAWCCPDGCHTVSFDNVPEL